MVTLKETLKAAATGDATLMSLLTGGSGVYLSDDVTKYENATTEWLIEEEITTDSGITVDPFAVMRFEDFLPFQEASAYKIRAEIGSFAIYIYHDRSHSAIDGIRQHFNRLFDDKIWRNMDDYPFAHTSRSFQSAELEAVEYQLKPMQFVRYDIRRA